eukprot:TRINITY_DN7362_c2_g1_i1.p1 TRINITY_DN7362_c2_g1~~TRINITY_DN7362_c2_g1_i1.p1  ORF type:complete len:209 (-),score=87.97 TRINITY_DN7362_c2_g1_i1:115-741(-)
MRDYFDIDDFLSEEEKVPIKMKIKGYKLGYLEGGTNTIYINNNNNDNDDNDNIQMQIDQDDEDIKEGTKVEVSLWIMKIFVERSYADYERPKILGQKMESDLKADPNAVSLGVCQQYYQFGVKFGIISKDNLLIEHLSNIFSQRARLIIDRALNHLQTDSFTFLRRLSSIEQNLFIQCRQYAIAFQNWKTLNSQNISAASIFTSTTKF